MIWKILSSFVNQEIIHNYVKCDTRILFGLIRFIDVSGLLDIVLQYSNQNIVLHTDNMAMVNQCSIDNSCDLFRTTVLEITSHPSRNCQFVYLISA